MARPRPLLVTHGAGGADHAAVRDSARPPCVLSVRLATKRTPLHLVFPLLKPSTCEVLAAMIGWKADFRRDNQCEVAWPFDLCQRRRRAGAGIVAYAALRSAGAANLFTIAAICVRRICRHSSVAQSSVRFDGKIVARKRRFSAGNRYGSERRPWSKPVLCSASALAQPARFRVCGSAWCRSLRMPPRRCISAGHLYRRLSCNQSRGPHGEWPSITRPRLPAASTPTGLPRGRSAAIILKRPISGYCVPARGQFA